MTTLKKLTPKLLRWFDRYGLELGIAFLLIFIPLYPKLPLIDLRHTWVYIRFEDFLVALVVGFWLLQLKRKKVSFKTPLTGPIFLYWLIGFLSLLNALLFYSRGRVPHFFSHLAFFHYLRRLEYMVLFLAAAATIKNWQTVKRYLGVMAAALILVCLYGFGQKFLNFPAFLTMNEEFAKGQPLFLGPTSRISSTFAGHYDLAAYLVLMISLFGSLFFGVRRRLVKGLVFLMLTAGFALLLLTASRISFVACLIAIAAVFYWQKKKWLIALAIFAGILLASFTSGSSERFGKTFRIENVVYSRQTGLPINTVDEFLNPSLGLDPDENLPLGSGFLSFGQLSREESKAQILKKQTSPGPIPSATVSAQKIINSEDYLVKKAIVYDISFTTRYQGQWPLAWQAFKRNILLGSGFSSLFLATDNDYLRNLGETGLLGFLSFFGILVAFVILVRESLKKITDPLPRSLIIGTLAGLLGLVLNAVLIDVFEASKVAFTFWILLGMAVGLIQKLSPFKKDLLKEWLKLFKHPLVTLVTLTVLAFAVYGSALKNYFNGDDFTWLRWALTTESSKELLNYFTSAAGFFYRPLAKVYYYLAGPLLGLKPFGYHLASLCLHLGCTFAVYFLSLRLTKKEWPASLIAFLFLIHPINSETIFWISTTSHLMASFFFLWGFLAYWFFRSACTRKNGCYFLCLALFLLGLASHERMVAFPLILLLFDFAFGYLSQAKNWLKTIGIHFPFWFFLGVYLWVRNYLAGAHGLSGDYNYNLKNLAFNFGGNLLGYFGELVASFHFIPVYDWLRLSLRTHKSIALILGGVLFLVLIWRGKKDYSQIKISKEQRSLILFSSGWFLICLLPFLGLGNMAERYVYPAHFGFFLLLFLFFERFYQQLKRKGRLKSLLAAGLTLSLLTGFYLSEIRKAKEDWFRAGETANRILLTVEEYLPELPSQSHLFFVDLPIRENRAWIFPVGLKDALWFVYQDESLKISRLTDLQLALSQAVNQPSAYVFLYQSDRLKLIEP